MMRRVAGMALAIGLLASPCAWAEADPVFSSTGPDAVEYGANAGYPTGPSSPLLPQVFMVGNYSHYDRVLRANRIERPAAASVLRRAPQELALNYDFRGSSYSLDDYLARNPTPGMLIARGDTILFEHYQYARTDRDRLLSQSMAKTVTAMLFGIALHEGAIRSIDQTAAEYVPELAGTEYGGTKLRDLLHMASGVAFREVYDGNDDTAALGRGLFSGGNTDSARIVARFNTREEPPGTRFHYAGAETEVLGLVLSNAVQMSLAEYAQSRLWQPMGAEADATWSIDTTGRNVAFCCFSATLRDWARFALLLAHDGAWNGRQVIPSDWVIASTSVAAPYLAPGVATRYDGYGNQVWLLGGPRREFALRGIHGQTIFVDPAAKLVLVHMAVRLHATADAGAAELAALWRAVVAHFAE